MKSIILDELETIQMLVGKMRDSQYRTTQAEWWALQLAWEALRCAWYVCSQQSVEKLGSVKQAIIDLEHRTTLIP
jgi:hypothetical protein